MSDFPAAPGEPASVAATEIDPTKPVKFEGNPGAGDSLIRYAPQTTGVSCAGFSLAYAMLRTGVARDQAGRQLDVTAVKDLLSALGTPVGGGDAAAFASFASGAMKPSELQQMANAIYLGGIGQITPEGQKGYSAAQVARYANALCAFGGFSGVSFSIEQYSIPGDSHFLLNHSGTYANSIPNGKSKAAVANDPQLPAGSSLVATIAVGSGVSLTKNGDTKSGNNAPVGSTVTISVSAVSHDKPGYQTADAAAVSALTGTPNLQDL